MIRTVLSLTLLLVLASCSIIDFDHIDPLDDCGTQRLWEMKLHSFGNKALVQPKKAVGCSYGDCDSPDYRDTSNQGEKVVRIVFNVMCSSNGTFPSGITKANLLRLTQRLKGHYQPYGISFDSTIVYNNDDEYFCLPPYSSGIFPEWSRALDSMKKQYAINPSTTLNVFVSCQQAGSSGTLNGIATFPWDSDALTSLGGLWINSQIVTTENQDTDDPVLFHELGHNFGLWHTFHGVSEVAECSPCSENYHTYDAPGESLVGDLCSDTPATPKNYYCIPPQGVDCNGTSWGYTNYQNLMGYSRYPNNCRSSFTDQQRKRMHCWLCNALSSQVVSGC